MLIHSEEDMGVYHMDETDAPLASNTHEQQWKHQRVSGVELPLTEEDMHDREEHP